MGLYHAYLPVMAFAALFRDRTAGDESLASLPYETVRRDLEHLLERAGRQSADVPEAARRQALLAVCAFADEAMLTSSWTGRLRWSRETLQRTLLGTVNAGRDFYEQCERLLAARGQVPAAPAGGRTAQAQPSREQGPARIPDRIPDRIAGHPPVPARGQGSAGPGHIVSGAAFGSPAGRPADMPVGTGRTSGLRKAARLDALEADRVPSADRVLILSNPLPPEDGPGRTGSPRDAGRSPGGRDRTARAPGASPDTGRQERAGWFAGRRRETRPLPMGTSPDLAGLGQDGGAAPAGSGQARKTAAEGTGTVPDGLREELLCLYTAALGMGFTGQYYAARDTLYAIAGASLEQGAGARTRLDERRFTPEAYYMPDVPSRRPAGRFAALPYLLVPLLVTAALYGLYDTLLQGHLLHWLRALGLQ